MNGESEGLREEIKSLRLMLQIKENRLKEVELIIMLASLNPGIGRNDCGQRAREYFEKWEDEK